MVNVGNFVGRYSTVSVLSCFFQKSLVESGYFVKWDLVTKALYILDSNWRIKQQFLPLVVKEVTQEKLATFIVVNTDGNRKLLSLRFPLNQMFLHFVENLFFFQQELMLTQCLKISKKVSFFQIASEASKVCIRIFAPKLTAIRLFFSFNFLNFHAKNQI